MKGVTFFFAMFDPGYGPEYIYFYVTANQSILWKQFTLQLGYNIVPKHRSMP